jgi:hypothetical protein
MILRHALRVFRQFSRIVHPNLSKYDNVFQVMREREYGIKTIEACNKRTLN